MRGVVQKIKQKSGFADNRFGGFATSFSAFKVSAKSDLFLGQMTANAARDDGAQRAFDLYP
ncbi:MAG: hypothetical protein ACI8UG_000202 [Gammaproteobacteria bacterium]|jgi:hypothetical protein